MNELNHSSDDPTGPTSARCSMMRWASSPMPTVRVLLRFEGETSARLAPSGAGAKTPPARVSGRSTNRELLAR